MERIRRKIMRILDQMKLTWSHDWRTDTLRTSVEVRSRHSDAVVECPLVIFVGRNVVRADLIFPFRVPERRRDAVMEALPHLRGERSSAASVRLDEATGRLTHRIEHHLRMGPVWTRMLEWLIVGGQMELSGSLKGLLRVLFDGVSAHQAFVVEAPEAEPEHMVDIEDEDFDEEEEEDIWDYEFWEAGLDRWWIDVPDKGSGES